MDLLLLAIDPADPAGLARGRYPVPAWVIWLAAGGVVLLCVAIVIVRVTRARRAMSAGEAPRKGP